MRIPIQSSLKGGEKARGRKMDALFTLCMLHMGSRLLLTYSSLSGTPRSHTCVFFIPADTQRLSLCSLLCCSASLPGVGDCCQNSHLSVFILPSSQVLNAQYILITPRCLHLALIFPLGFQNRIFSLDVLMEHFELNMYRRLVFHFNHGSVLDSVNSKIFHPVTLTLRVLHCS